MMRQALYRVEWDDAGQNPGAASRPPGVIGVVQQIGPWGDFAANVQLLYEGPLGRTTVTVEWQEPDVAKGGTV